MWLCQPTFSLSVYNQDVGVGAPEQSVFSVGGAGARILIEVELEQRYYRIGPSSRSSHFPIAFLYHRF